MNNEELHKIMYSTNKNQGIETSTVSNSENKSSLAVARRKTWRSSNLSLLF